MVLPDWWQRRWIKWINIRTSRQSIIRLTRRNLYIFPTGAGMLFIALAIVLFILGSNYQNNLMLLLSFFIPAAMLTSLFACYQQLQGFSLTVHSSGPHFAGQPCHVALTLQRTRPAFGRWRIHQRHTLLADVPTHTEPVWLNIGHLPRGEHHYPTLTLSSRYPWGLFRCWCHLRFTGQLLIYPAPLFGPTTPQWLPASAHQQGQHQVGDEEFDRLVDYQQGESLGKIAWKQLAQGRGMLTKQFNQEGQHTQWLQLRGQPGINIEQQLSYLCGQIITLAAEQHYYGLLLPNQRIEPNNNPDHQWQCLSALARYPAT